MLFWTHQCHIVTWIFCYLAILPTVKAMPTEDPYSAITFKVFAEFIKENFSSKISLASVMVLLFSMMENPDLLTLHARQQNPYPGKYKIINSAWMASLVRALTERLGRKAKHLLRHGDIPTNESVDENINVIGGKLDAFAKMLQLYPYSENNHFLGKLKPVSRKSIEAVHMICPEAVECETTSCRGRSLQQITRSRDIPKVTLIKGSDIHQNAHVLTGKCSQCKTLYMADHKRVEESDERLVKVYLNSAHYLKAGQSLWVDRICANAVLNGMYSFHASAAAYSEYWSNSFGKHSDKPIFKISRRQIWHIFVQESVRTIAAASGQNLILGDGLAIDEVTQEAFYALGKNGIIEAGQGHSCSDCTHEYKQNADTLDNSDAMDTNMDVDMDAAPVQMIVIDGNVMGPFVSVNSNGD